MLMYYYPLFAVELYEVNGDRVHSCFAPPWKQKVLFVLLEQNQTIIMAPNHIAWKMDQKVLFVCNQVVMKLLVYTLR